jgi:3'-phosphoadenosine 5'-phosphosulfate sulfotransferase (PAPS reductase)/FAD synthetase
MSEDQIKSEYNAVLASGMFWEFFPNYTGTWSSDRAEFIAFVEKRDRNRIDIPVGMQPKIFGGDHILHNPKESYGLMDKLLECKEIVQKAIITHRPYATGLMLSGGDDSITALQVALMLGVKIDFIMHGVTGTGLKSVRTYVHQVANRVGIRLIEADAGSKFEDRVMKKGFFGMGKVAHTYSYHILKSGPFEAAISKHIRKGVSGRKILLLNGVRIEESDNRLDNFGDNPYRERANNIWVNIIHWLYKKECLTILEGEGVKRNPASIVLGRSCECNCGTMQNEADRLAIKDFEPEWWEWMWDLRKRVIGRFGFDINQQPNKKRMAEIKAATAHLSEDMPMCVGCKARQPSMFEGMEL